MKAPLAALLFLLAACSPPPAQPGVASISTPNSSAAPTSAAQEQRPRERLDMTPEDIDALYAAYDRCLGQFGMDKQSQVAARQAGTVPPKAEEDKALKACESKDPLPPWEKDVNNPEAVDFANRVVQCLRGKGVRYVEVHNEPGAEQVSYAFGGPNNDAASITLGLEHAKECEIEASKK
ncbi:hypothetical protein [Lentzea nigeriaca]|uniref:hypothetical protein n=1 Tax=Lentzea nigeriaca TaxID=1128665 RepID=UPI00195ACE69|nr:hypothetical protein [Lentzea nigeriaca]MBM7862325.1 hypothetical protein [Lentzea nigeriaca]